MKKNILIFLAAICSMQLFAQPTFQIPSGTTTVKLTGGVYLVLSNFNFYNSGTFQQAAGDGHVKFMGSDENVIFGPGVTVFDQLLLAKTTGAQLRLFSNIAIVSGIDFGGGLLNVEDIVIDMGATAQLTNESETNYAYSLGTGYIQSTANLNAPTSVNPGTLGAIITSASNLGNTVIRRSFLPANNSYGNGSSILRKFDITPTNNTSLNATFRFQYLDAELNGIDESVLVFWKSPDNTTWTAKGLTSRDVTSNYVELTGINDFSSWTLSTPLNALPAVFGNITAFEQGSDIIVQWEVLTEQNVARYNIQRSSDGSGYSTIGYVAAINLPRYSFADHQPLTGNNYYRLQIVDLDNRAELSRVVKINTTKGNPGIAILPNPVVGQRLTLQFTNLEKGMYNLDLYTNSGQQIYSGTINHPGGSVRHTVQLPATITTGIYQFRVKNSKLVLRHSLILK